MHALFPGDPGAEVLYAGALARSGRFSAAAAILEATASSPDHRLALDRLRAGKAVWMGGRLPVEAMKAVDAHPGDPALIDMALATLLEGGAYDDFLVLLKRADERGLAFSRQDLFSAYACLLRGEKTAAEDSFRLALESAPGPEALLALGILAFDRSDFTQAGIYLDRALALARSPGESCLILKSQGRLADRLGDLALARERYLAASRADPSDPEAWRLAHR